MIHSVVVHLVVDVLADRRLVGVVEDVATGDRRRFLGADELIAHLEERVRSGAPTVGPSVVPDAPTGPPSADR